MIEVKRITLLTRHVDFTIKAKHALERNGIYFVNAFTSVQNMMSFLETNQQDTAILDLTVREVVPDKLIVQIRDLQPNLRIVVSPNHPAVLTALASLNIQGIIDIPMPTRQLLSFMKKMDQASVAEPRILMPNSADNLEIIEGMDQGATTDQTPPKTEPSKNAEELFQRLAAEEPPLPDFEESATIQDVVSNFISLPSAEKLEILLTPDPEITRDATSEEDIRLNLAAQILEATQDNSTPVNALLTKVKEKLAAEDAASKATEGEAVVEEDLPALPKVTLEYTAPTTTFSELNQPEEANDLATDRMLPVIRSRPILQGDFPSLDELRPDIEDTSEEDVPVEVPAEEPTVYPTVEEPAASEIAQLAVMLTEMSLETAAEALILTRGDAIVGYSGRLPRIEIESLKDIITTGWEPDRKTLLNYVRLESTSMDYLLYSIRTTNDHTLSLLFLGAMPVTAIRRQGRKIADALTAMPHDEDGVTEDDSELIDTTLGERSREERAIALSEKDYPDALPVNLSEAQASVIESVIPAQDIAEEESLVDEEDEEFYEDDEYEDESVELAVAESSVTPEPELLVAYNFVWLLRDATQPLTNEAAQALIGSLNTILSGRTWRIRNLDVYGDFVYLRADVPQSQAANKAVREAMQASAEALQPTTPAWAKDLWADSYLVVPSERELQLDEIQEFIQFARS